MAECEANSKLQSRFDLLSSQLHSHNGRSSATSASVNGDKMGASGAAAINDSEFTTDENWMAPQEEEIETLGSGEWGGVGSDGGNGFGEDRGVQIQSPKSLLQGLQQDYRKKK